ncbi:MAG TPA: aldo/keto reductase, partial [Hyphomicrobiales bacterium]|nr:aldo/keto reductase [Hyphomicrobiales bacterium]
MRYRLLGRSGLKVSELCLGTMMFGGQTDAPTSERLIGKAFDAGINMLDTADQYNAGRSEEICGKAIKDKRQQWILATKVANIMGPSLNERGLSRRWMYQALEASLKRLGTDYVDIYYLHREDYNTPLETTISAIGDLIKQGKVRYFGVSNFRAWRVAEICAICDRLGIDRPI